MRAWQIAAIIAILLVGLIMFDFYRASMAARSLEVKEASLKDFSIDLGWKLRAGIPPIEPTIRGVHLTLTLTLENPSDYETRVRELEYEVYLNGRRIAKGNASNIDLPQGERAIDLPLDIDVNESASIILNSLISAVSHGSTSMNLSYEVRGSARIPVTILGIEVPGADVTVPFSKRGVYKLGFNIPS